MTKFQMNQTPQSLYANNLRQSYGYPLRSPTPFSRTKDDDSRRGTGLSIGDVGYVNEEGAFEVLPTIEPKVKIDRNKIHTPKTMAIPRNTPIFSGVERIGLESSDAYRFIAKLKAGAILILPSGAQLKQVQDQQELDDICAFAVQHARSWRNSCSSNTLFLITGLYNTTSWTLGAFDSCEKGHEIIVTESQGQCDNDGVYEWAATSTVYAQTCTQKSNFDNQTVFIKGFKITFRDEKIDRVESMWGGQNTWTSRVRSSLKRLASQLLRVLSQSMSVKRYPNLSQPPHYWDLINRHLIEKHQADVAVTHDDVWIKMLEKLGSEEVQESDLRDYIDREYDCLSNTSGEYFVAYWRPLLSFILGAVYLQRRSASEDPHTAHENSESSSATENPESLSATENPESSFATENSYIVITHIRAENVIVGLGYVPAGFFVRVDVVGGTSRRTGIKPALVHDHVIQWDNRIIHLPFHPSTKVQLVICASFELSPMLGRGVPLCASPVICMSDLLSKQSILFTSSEMTDPLSSTLSPTSHSMTLLFSAQQWHGGHLMSGHGHVVHEDEYSVPQAVTDATDSGQRDLHLFYRTHGKEDLESCIKHFEHALLKCPMENLCRAVVMSNLAKAQFLSDQFLRQRQFLNDSLQLFRDALQSRVGDHLDRPMTLLNLSQALLYYGALGHTSAKDELHEILPDLMAICSRNTHEHIAAELVEQTCDLDRIRLRGSNDSSKEELKTLISKMESAAQELPDDYFDKPIRFNNLGLALQRRFQLFHKPDDALDKAAGWLDQAVQITPHWHPNKSRYEDDWSDTILYRFEQQHDAPITRRSLA